MEKEEDLKTDEEGLGIDGEARKVFDEIYEEIKVFPDRFRTPKNRERVGIGERVVISSPQINRLAYEKEDKQTRSKMLQAVCEAPNIVTMFHQNKMFVKGKDANAKFISNSIPVQTINRKDCSKNFMKTRKRTQLKVKHSVLIKDFKSALGEIKNNSSRSSSRSKQAASTPRMQNDFQRHLCLALQSIEKQCELTRDCKTPESVVSIPKKQKSMKDWTSRVQWTASKLQKWENLNTNIMKELYNHEKSTKKTQEQDAEDLSFTLHHKSCHEIRNQSKFIKKVLINKKMKIL